MRIAFSGDQHIEAMHLTTIDEQKRALESLIDLTIGAKAKTIVLLGDATHTRRPGPAALALWGDFFRTCDEEGVRAIAVAGNHEREAVTSLFSFFRGSVEAVTEPRIITLYTDDGPPIVDLACLPWLPDALVRAAAAGAMSKEEVAYKLTEAAGEILRGFIAKKRVGVPLILATHATIAGAKTSSGFDMGFMPTTDYIVRTEDLHGFDGVFAGHIHKRQGLYADDFSAFFLGMKTPIAYTGSLLPLDFSETEPKGFLVYDTATKLVETIDVPTPSVATWDLELDGAIRELVLSAEAGFPSELPPAKLRVRVRCDEATAREFPPARIEAAIRKHGATFVQVELTVERPDRERGIAIERAPSGALGDYLATRTDLDPAARMRIDGAATEVLRDESAAHPAQGDIDLVGLHVENFLGVALADLTLDGLGIYSLTGPVGSGKSTVGVDGFRYALFGESRIGAKLADRLVRVGADTATVAVTLRSMEDIVRIVRKTKRTARGATTSLDVLSRRVDEREWSPVSIGKIADGEAQITRFLGGLDDETLCAANLVVQRSADSFTRARPEERKRLIAQAAGLQVYESLTQRTIAARAESERGLMKLDAKAEALRARAAALEEAEREAEYATGAAEAQAMLAAEFEAKVAPARDELAAASLALVRYDELQRQVADLRDQMRELTAERDTWSHKRKVAEAIVATKAELLKAKDDLAIARANVADLEQKIADGEAVNERRADMVAEHERRAAAVRDLVSRRKVEHARLSARIDAVEKNVATLDASECAVIDDIRGGKIAPCAFLRGAKADSESLDGLAHALGATEDATPEEAALIEAATAYAVTIPVRVDLTMTREALKLAREKVVQLERQAGVAEKIAAAEAVIATGDAAMRTLDTRHAELDARRLAREGDMMGIGANPRAAATLALTVLRDREHDAEDARGGAARMSELAAEARGKVASLRTAKADLDVIEAELRTEALRFAAIDELVRAWRACRVMVLEGSVIPGIEDQANDILRRFPYGLQVALRTQRDTRDGTKAETLDIEVLGGRGGLYELCSGGERTTIDTALHVALALIVARRSSTRLRFMVVDEPEGLDEAGRMAFAAVMRWVNETHRVAVIAMSHMPDLVDALGGERLVAIPGENGSEVRAA